MASDGFGDLVRKAEELCATFETDVELPRVERSLLQILETGQKLWSKSQHAASEDAVNIKAATLLGPKGLGVPRMSQKLESLNTVKTFEPLEPVNDTDVRSFLKNERDNALLAAIESTKKKTWQEAEERHWDSMRDEWEREKQKLLNALLGTQQDSAIDFSVDYSMNASVAGDSHMTRHGPTRSAMDAVELAYAQQIYIYNESVTGGGTVSPLLLKMLDVAANFTDEHLKEVWHMVDAVSQTPTVLSGSIAATRQSAEMERSVIRNSKVYLEKCYLKHIQQTVNRNLQTAKLGGVPGTLQLVKSYLNVIRSPQNPGLEDMTVDNQPVWPLIYFTLRCGDVQAACQVAEIAAPSIGEFSGFLKEYATHGSISKSSSDKMALYYRRQVRNSTDPYKRLLYCLVGCCDLVDAHPEVADKIDDFLWLRLSQIEASADTGADDSRVLRLSKLQTQLLDEFGESHFQAQQRPFLYFQVLLLTGQFEAAIEFLSRHDRLQSHAVHIALVFYELNLLLLPSSIQTHLLSKDPSDPSPLRRLNLARLIMMYTRKFEATDPREALQYFYFLRNIKGPNGDSLFVTCISELVLETKEFELLLGKIDANGKRKPGAIDKFHSDTKHIIESVALDTEKKGMFEEAIKLYDLAQSRDKATKLLSQILSRHLSEPAIPGSTKDRIKSLALDIARRYRTQTEISKQLSTTFYLLLDLMLFFDQFHNEEFDQALDIIKQLKLMPLTLDTVEVRVNAFKYFDEEIRQALPDVMLATMNILLSSYKSIRPGNANGSRLNQSSFSFSLDDGGRHSMVSELRENARSLITFAGMLPYRLPGDVSSKLIQMEVLMN